MRLRELRNSITAGDTILLIVLLTVSFIGLVFIQDVIPEGTDVIIEVKNEHVFTLSLYEDTRKEIHGANGITIVEIKDQKVRVTDSSCPDKICVKQGEIKKGVIICLPNQVIIRIDSVRPENKQFDAVTG